MNLPKRFLRIDQLYSVRFKGRLHKGKRLGLKEGLLIEAEELVLKVVKSRP